MILINMILLISNLTLADCKVPNITNESAYPIEAIDIRARTGAIKTCKVRYKKCLVKFIKKDKHNYWTICGQRN